jgi:hypothetical protein
LKVDYVTDVGYFRDLTINTDNAVYAFSVFNYSGAQKMELQRITPDGRSNKLVSVNPNHGNPRITNDNDGKLYYIGGFGDLSGRIRSFSVDYTPSTIYTMQGADQLNVLMYEFRNLTDDTFAIYDDHLKKFKLYSKSQNTDFAIAGMDNGPWQMIDGIGANANFIYAKRMKTLNNVIYFIDSSRYIRKIDCSSEDYNVSTIYNLNYHDIEDFAVDANEDIYAIIRSKGIYKLTNGSYSVYKDGVENIKSLNNNESSTIDWKAFTNIYINNNDLYLVSGPFKNKLIKISNFKEKL